MLFSLPRMYKDNSVKGKPMNQNERDTSRIVIAFCLISGVVLFAIALIGEMFK